MIRVGVVDDGALARFAGAACQDPIVDDGALDPCAAAVCRVLVADDGAFVLSEEQA